MTAAPRDDAVARLHAGPVVDMVTNLVTEGVPGWADDCLAGGVDLVCQSIDPTWRHSAHVRPYLDVMPDAATAFRTLAWLRAAVARDDRLLLAQDVPADVERARASGRLAVMAHSQTSTQFGMDLDLVHELHAAGLRMTGLAYNLRTPAADGCVEETDAGLSRFGRRLVEECNDAGLVVDGSHAGVRSTLDAIEVSGRPVVFSHNGCRALYDHPRNLTDEQLRACAARGGVVGVVAVPAFLAGTARIPLSVLGDHVLHAVDVAGAEHVGLGLDWFWGFEAYAAHAWPDVDPAAGGGTRRPRDVGDLLWDPQHLPPPGAVLAVDDLPTPARLPALTRHLLDRGLSEAELALVLGGSWLRVLGAWSA
ncbi:dipeptidase [Kineosporia sp. A_224]|uniref:dipeptidase n=1 Tax=Kineosporia sp. A_224 TaxID=1962180 RepID=UPI000B4BC106|nr:membrane dipeptidase [Kineosporia sp. A_224]